MEGTGETEGAGEDGERVRLSHWRIRFGSGIRSSAPFFATNKKTSFEKRPTPIRPYVFPPTSRIRFPLDGGHGMGLVRPAFMEMNQFSFLHLDFWMLGARTVRVRS